MTQTLSSNQASTRPIDALIEFLRKEEARGIKHVYLDDSAREDLRALFIKSKNPVPKDTAPEVIAPSVKLDLTGKDKIEQLEQLRIQAENWAPARSLGTLRDTLVFSRGNPDAELFFVGEAPGYYEEKEKKLFVGEIGEKLNQILKTMGLIPEQVYLSSFVKFRPSLPRQSTNNRKPTHDEILACKPLVLAEISIIKPKLIIALGNTAAAGLMESPDSFENMRGQWHELNGTPMRVSFHPAVLLQRDSTSDTKRALWEDMLAVMEKLGMPISEKQRNFFLPKNS